MRFRVKRQLSELTRRIHRAEEEVIVLDAQVLAAGEDVDATRIQSLVSESPLADVEYDSARRQHQVLERERERLREQIVRFRDQRDDLLDRLVD